MYSVLICTLFFGAVPTVSAKTTPVKEKTSMTFTTAKNLSVSISRKPQDVYDFAAKPENLPKWAGGLANSKVTHSGDDWIMESPLGKVKVRFAPQNSYGVLDHDVAPSRCGYDFLSQCPLPIKSRGVCPILNDKGAGSAPPSPTLPTN